MFLPGVSIFVFFWKSRPTGGLDMVFSLGIYSIKSQKTPKTYYKSLIENPCPNPLLGDFFKKNENFHSREKHSSVSAKSVYKRKNAIWRHFGQKNDEKLFESQKTVPLMICTLKSWLWEPISQKVGHAPPYISRGFFLDTKTRAQPIFSLRTDVHRKSEIRSQEEIWPRGGHLLSQQVFLKPKGHQNRLKNFVESLWWYIFRFKI